jgi:hypothetical protein
MGLLAFFLFLSSITALDFDDIETKFFLFAFLAPKKRSREEKKMSRETWQFMCVERQKFCSRFSTKRNLMGFLVLFVTPCRLISLKLFPYQYENCLFMMLRDIAI